MTELTAHNMEYNTAKPRLRFPEYGRSVQAMIDVAKTIADCFKYRSKIGLDVALDALKQTLDEGRATRAEIRSIAQVCRVENVMRPYMDALSI